MEFLVFGEDYNRHPSSTQHLINEIKKTYSVQWVNSIGMRKPKLNKTDILRVFEKLSGKNTTIYPSDQIDFTNLHLVKPIVYPLAENPFLVKLNNFLMKHQLHKKTKIQRIVWLTLPSAVDYLNITDGDLVVYYCCDDFGSLNGVDHELVTEKEKRLVEKADIVFTTSNELYKKLKSNKTFMLPHGVHKKFFEINDKKIDDKNIKLGFYGGIDTRINFKLIEELLEKNKNLSLEMIGHIASDVDESFFDHPRITRFPAAKHNDLIEKVETWDILLLPFLHNGYSDCCNPLKLREYLATGKPVISTEMPAVNEYKDFLEIKETVQEWDEAINNFCQEATIDKEIRISGIKTILAKETWEHRANEAIVKILQTSWLNH